MQSRTWPRSGSALCMCLAFIATDLLWAACGRHSVWFLAALPPLAAHRRLFLCTSVLAPLSSSLYVVLQALDVSLLPRPLSQVERLLQGVNLVFPVAVFLWQTLPSARAPPPGPAPSPSDGAFRAESDRLDRGESSNTQSRVSLSVSSSEFPSGLLPPPRKSLRSGKRLRYSAATLIGTGGFAEVYLGLSHNTGELICVKQLSAGYQVSDVEHMEAGVAVLRELHHPNIVQYLGTDRADHFTILMEYVAGGCIAGLLEKYGAFEDEVAQHYVRQCLCGLEYLHNKGVIHRDIKGANILVSATGEVKLSDFGCSYTCMAPAEGVRILGTVLWMAPEVCREEVVHASCDIWALGCTVLQMLTNRLPWTERGFDTCIAAFYHITTCAEGPHVPDHVSAVARDFINACVRVRAELRPDCAELLQHVWLEEVSDDEEEFLESMPDEVPPKSPRWFRTPTTATPPERRRNSGPDALKLQEQLQYVRRQSHALWQESVQACPLLARAHNLPSSALPHPAKDRVEANGQPPADVVGDPESAPDMVQYRSHNGTLSTLIPRLTREAPGASYALQVESPLDLLGSVPQFSTSPPTE